LPNTFPCGEDAGPKPTIKMAEASAGEKRICAAIPSITIHLPLRLLVVSSASLNFMREAARIRGQLTCGRADIC